MSPTMSPDVAPMLSREKTLSQTQRKNSNPLTLVLGLAIVALLAGGAWRMLAKPSGATEERVQVVAAGADIPAGCRLGFTNLHYVELPKRYVTPDMVNSYELLVGRVSRTFVPQGEPILSSMMFPGKDGLSLNFENEERAITLSLSDDALVDHSIFPGDRVDVLVTSTADGKKYTKTICQGVPVLMSVSKQALLSQRSREERNKITLAATPAQSEELAEAAEVGRIRLVLRNRLSRKVENLSGAGERDILPAEALIAKVKESFALPVPLPPPTVLAPPPPTTVAAPPAFPNPLQWVVEVFSGSHKETYAFPQKPK